MSLRQLTYISRRASALELEETIHLITHAAEKNADVGITGFILFAPKFFVQVLEGDRAEVDKTFARIQADSRHTDLCVLSDTEVAARSFSEWSMGFASGSEEKEELLNGAGITPETELPTFDAPEALELLTCLSQL